MNDEKIVTDQDVIDGLHDEIAKLEWLRDGLMASVDSLHHEKIVLQKRVVELEQAQRWIPVTERVPTENAISTKWVWTSYEFDGYTYQGEGIYVPVTEPYWMDKAGNIIKVKHWMPLPKPPKGE